MLELFGAGSRASSWDVLFEDRHLSFHEAVEQRHGECRLAVPLAPDHALVHQLLPHSRH